MNRIPNTLGMEWPNMSGLAVKNNQSENMKQYLFDTSENETILINGQNFLRKRYNLIPSDNCS